jgi:hypothetical protein
MPDEALISQIENILTEVIELGGANERSQIVPNLTVQDANPAKTGFIIVSDDRDGDNIFAKKVGSVIYSNNDKVNVVFPRGGEAIAFQQGIFYDKGKVGIGTDEIPHGGVGWATLAIDGGDFAADGANIQLTTSADDYPTMQIFGGGTHDEVGIFFDSYYDGTNRSSTTDQNFQILATGGRLRFRYDSGVAAGAALSWNEGIALRTDGTVGIGTITPGAKLESVLSTGAQLRLSHTTASKFLDITVDTNHDATFKPSSTGQIIFQPTTDSTDFLQVLDADGGLPIVNIDAANERVTIGTDTPLADSLGTHRLTVYTTSNVGIQFGRFSANTGGPIMSFVKSRGASIGTHGAVLAGDRLGTIVFSGSDGVDFSTPVDMAQIYAEVDAVTGGTVYSGRLKFQTTNTSGTQTVAMTIDDGQNVGIGTTTPSTLGKLAVITDVNTKESFVIKQKSGQTALLTGWQDSAGTTIASMSIFGIFSTSTLSGTTGASIGGISIDVQNRTATVGNYSGIRGKNANGDTLGAYQFVADSHVAGTGQLRMGTSSAGTYAEAMRIDSSGNVGIGTTTPAANLQVSGASSPFLLITDTTNPCSTVIQSQDAEGFFGTTTAHPLSFTTNGSRVMTLTTAGNVGIGLTAPQGILHTYDTIGGFLIWEYDGLDATVRTVVPNGAGDCLYRLQVTWVFRNSAGVVVSGSIGVSNGGSTSPTVGTDTVRIRVNADGSIDVARTAGTNTIKVLLHLLWL